MGSTSRYNKFISQHNRVKETYPDWARPSWLPAHHGVTMVASISALTIKWSFPAALVISTTIIWQRGAVDIAAFFVSQPSAD